MTKKIKKVEEYELQDDAILKIDAYEAIIRNAVCAIEFINDFSFYLEASPEKKKDEK
ncbi:MAG: hypothetical protein O210_OD1C00001G0610 [Parcubacteria bacterium RAAC4_OD1_1]|nr:MAG: hypothetical protein O210_OD1C00001G0610 [Parcubacteria bacterium RAAC4_OD1_1]